ncbi:MULTISPECIES: hypothetical protein [unclassified Tolypothrix]|uniref:hypothetical protein n=1 Tax=unclassified Tolypothrix TaxID=2649714 RepID=UPI0005EAAD7B|nr:MULTISPECIES: hypothetical protein [unclassified Tolypothrix]EKF03714.1 hypothetical protein FDUTEX481_02285 [Tolypothrix sp. PCC 7601]UYD36286.1 hypothetical protein HG267_11415 [Tolypothrix sp. PCC 7601]
MGTGDWGEEDKGKSSNCEKLQYRTLQQLPHYPFPISNYPFPKINLQDILLKWQTFKENMSQAKVVP